MYEDIRVMYVEDYPENITIGFEWTPEISGSKGDYLTPDDPGENECFTLLYMRHHDGRDVTGVPEDVVMEVVQELCCEWGFDKYIDIDISRLK